MKVVFHSHLCPTECLLHPSAVSNKSGYLKVWVCLFIDEQTPECERNVLAKQHLRPQLCLKWDSRPEESFHTSKQKGVDNSVCVCVCAYASVWVSSTPAHPKYLATMLIVSLCVDTHTETLKSKQRRSDFRILCYRIETMKVLR